jgi:exopolysaccharide biosynthesis polyprenyl glycosylphosphotransferase
VRPRGRKAGRALVLALGDALTACAAFALVVALRRHVPLPFTTELLPAQRVPLDPFPWLVAVAASALVALVLAGTYDEPAASVRERGGLLVSALLAAASLVAVYFFAGRALPRTVILLFAPVLWQALELWRLVAARLVPIGMRPVIVLGDTEDAENAAAALDSGAITGHRLLLFRKDLGFLRPPHGDGTALLSRDGLDALLAAEGPVDLVFASSRPEDRLVLVGLLERSLEHDFDLWIVPGLTDVVATRVVTRSLGDLPVMPVATRGAGLAARMLRRTIDLTLGFGLLVLSIPFLAVVSLAVVLESRGPAWLKQRRVGLHGVPFDLWKVRTMRAGAEAGSGPTLAAPDDDRTTRVGRLLRKSRLDELPQLLHVVGGRMSLIGPRPERPEFVEEFERQVPAYRLRHALKPGITGLAQVMGAYATKPDVKLRYDLGYLFHWSPFLDLFILLRTVVTVLKATGV